MMNKKDNDVMFSIVYTLQNLHNKGISIQNTIQMSLSCLKDWYQTSGDYRYLELALQQMRAGFELGVSGEKYAELYTEICELAHIDLESYMVQNLIFANRIKPIKAQVRRMIGKWAPSKRNPMTIKQVVEDIIDKVTNQKKGIYYYCNRKSGRESIDELRREEQYKLVITETECYFINSKTFQIYLFE